MSDGAGGCKIDKIRVCFTCRHVLIQRCYYQTREDCNISHQAILDVGYRKRLRKHKIVLKAVFSATKWPTIRLTCRLVRKRKSSLPILCLKLHNNCNTTILSVYSKAHFAIIFVAHDLIYSPILFTNNCCQVVSKAFKSGRLCLPIVLAYQASFTLTIKNMKNMKPVPHDISSRRYY